MKATAILKSSATVFSNGSLRDYFHLTKPTITLLVAITVIPSLFLAVEGTPDTLTSLAAILGASLASASAAVFNQVVEMDIDSKMERTQGRSIAAGRVTKEGGIFFGLILGLGGLSLLYQYASPLAALIATFGHLFYVVIYTIILKRRTVQNIVIGGAAGAVGPLIGWAAMTGQIAWPAWALFALICLWTPPHFWALALKYKEDYAKAGIPMYPVVHGDHRTRRVMFLYTLTLIPCTGSLYFHDRVGVIYLVTSLALTAKFCFDSFLLYRSKSNAQAMPLFHYSCMYIFGIFGAITIDCLSSYL